MDDGEAIVIHPPKEVARRLAGISVAQLVAILKEHGYAYTELSPGAKPWGRGRRSWGMTDEQIATLIRGQERRHPEPAGTGPAAEVKSSSVRTRLMAMGWDGKDRLPKSKKTR